MKYYAKSLEKTNVQEMSASERVLARRDSQREENSPAKDKSVEKAQVSSKQMQTRKAADLGRANAKTSVGGRPKDSIEAQSKNLAEIKRRQVILNLLRIKKY